MKTLKELMEDWREYKKLENSVTEQRRQVETEMYKLMMKQVKFPNEGTTNHVEGNLKLKIISKLDYKVDQDAAAAIPHLFKAKYEYSKTMLKNFTDEQVAMVNEAITIKPGRPSFTVEEVTND